MQIEVHSSHHRYCVIPQSVQRRIKNHPLCSNLFLTEIGYEDETIFHPFTKSKGSHYLLVYVSKGEGKYRVNNKVYEVEENDFFVLPVRFATGLESSDKNPWSIYWAYFAGSQADKVVQHLAGGKHSPMKAKPLVGRIAQFNDILHHLELMENIENLVYANSRFYSFLCSFRLMVLSGKKYGSKDGVIQTIEYMRENISNVISLDDLAEVAGLSVSHYCAMFRQKTMQTPMQLYTSMKIQRACQLLQNRNQTIKSISYSLGFFDQYHFSKVFKHIMGVSPKEFRSHGDIGEAL
jgi:AraC family transcriptional regulator, arabinose operon regulatory protein